MAYQPDLYLFDLGDSRRVVAPSLTAVYEAIDKTARDQQAELAKRTTTSRIAPGLPVTKIS